MTKTVGLLALVLFVVGCGGDGGDPALQGDWIINTGASCALQLSFSGSSWEADQLCTLTDGSVGVEVDGGPYTTSGNSLTMTTTESSCEGVMAVLKVQQGTFSRSGASLTLNFGTNILLFQMANGPPQGQGTATLGCLDNTAGTFTPNPIRPVP